MVESVTDNRLRTAQEVRSAFDRSGGTLGGPGSVTHLFKQIGQITVEFSDEISQDDILLVSADSGADDVDIFEKEALVYCGPNDLEKVKEGLSQKGLKIVEAKLSRKPISSVKIDDEKTADQVLSLVNKLEDLQDVQTVYANFDISEEILERNADIMT